MIISNSKGGYSIKPLQLRMDLTITHAQLQGFCLRPALGFKRTSTVAQREVKSAFQFNRSNASDVTMADPPSDQSRQPPNHLLRSPPVRDVTIDASRAGFDTGRPRNRVMEVTEVSNSHAPIPPPPPPPQAPSTHPLTSARLAMATTPLEGVGNATGVGFDCSDPREPAEEVGGDDETHKSKKLAFTCLPSFDCNADSEGLGGTTERIFAMPSAQKATVTNEKKVSSFVSTLILSTYLYLFLLIIVIFYCLVTFDGCQP